MLLRTARPRPGHRVLVHGLVYFGQVFSELMDGDGWSFRYFPDSGLRNLASMASELNSCDLVYQIGGRVTRGRFLRAAHLLRKRRIVMHWVGSDTLDERKDVAAGNADPWVVGGIRHWAESDWLLREVSALGVPCQLIPLPSGRVPERPSPLPSEFRVLVYVPTVTRRELYGLDRVLDVARALPHIPFDLVGLLDGPIPDPPANLRIHGRIPDLDSFYRRSSVVWRPVRHDGLSWMVLEALGHGRHVLWTYPLPGCIQVADASDARLHIERLFALHAAERLALNEHGVRFIADDGYSPRHLKFRIREKLQELLDA